MKGFGEKDNSENKKASNSNTIASKEEIINQAFKFHSQGNISEAGKYYQIFLDKGFSDARVSSNIGQLLKDLGKLEEAEFHTRKAIKLDPNLPGAHANLGMILSHCGKSKEAEVHTRKAIELDPNFATAYLNLGTILSDLGKLKEAEIYMRKAIELNPDYADAHSNLGFILLDLGKLQELIMLSESTLESRSINQGYKLLASVRITITNLLQKDFSETQLSIKKTNDLINKGSLNTIKDNKNRSYALTYSRFINSLYPLLEKETKHLDSKKIPHFGESHCLSFAHQNLSISSQVKTIQPVLISGGKAWHFASKNNNRWKDSLTQQITNHTYSDLVFISFGEIDCRKNEGILAYASKKNEDVSETCNKTIKGYLNYMELKLSPHYSKRYYFGIPAPQRSPELPDELDMKRVEMIKLYNSLLKKEVLSRGSYFVNVYDLTSNKDGENNDIFMCDDNHLSPKCLSILFENYLYKS